MTTEESQKPMLVQSENLMKSTAPASFEDPSNPLSGVFKCDRLPRKRSELEALADAYTSPMFTRRLLASKLNARSRDHTAKAERDEAMVEHYFVTEFPGWKDLKMEFQETRGLYHYPNPDSSAPIRHYQDEVIEFMRQKVVLTVLSREVFSDAPCLTEDDGGESSVGVERDGGADENDIQFIEALSDLMLRNSNNLANVSVGLRLLRHDTWVLCKPLTQTPSGAVGHTHTSRQGLCRDIMLSYLERLQHEQSVFDESVELMKSREKQSHELSALAEEDRKLGGGKTEIISSGHYAAHLKLMRPETDETVAKVFQTMCSLHEKQVATGNAGFRERINFLDNPIRDMWIPLTSSPVPKFDKQLTPNFRKVEETVFNGISRPQMNGDINVPLAKNGFVVMCFIPNYLVLDADPYCSGEALQYIIEQQPIGMYKIVFYSKDSNKCVTRMKLLRDLYGHLFDFNCVEIGGRRVFPCTPEVDQRDKDNDCLVIGDPRLERHITNMLD